MVFQFELMDLDYPTGEDHSPLIHRDWKLLEMKEIVGRWQRYKRDEGFWNRQVRRGFNESFSWNTLPLVYSSKITTKGAQFRDSETTRMLGVRFPQNYWPCCRLHRVGRSMYTREKR